MKKLIRKVMMHPTIIERPPVLVDIGASGSLPRQWKLIAPYSICIAFDADTRDFSASNSSEKGYKTLFLLNRLVSENSSDQVNFYLTKSPHCSSSLMPNTKGVEPWAFRNLFEVDKSIKMPAVCLSEAIKSCGFDYIDWYKSDSQGMDLRIFNSLDQDILVKLIIAEFEPGIINAYIGEDKLHQLMSYMDKMPFWISNMIIKGSYRIDPDDLNSLNLFQQKSISTFLKMAPGWCEISYINNFDDEGMSFREYLLGWVFSSIMCEHGFALRVANIGATKYQDLIFNEMISSSKNSILKGYWQIPSKFFRKTKNLLFGSLN